LGREKGDQEGEKKFVFRERCGKGPERVGERDQVRSEGTDNPPTKKTSKRKGFGEEKEGGGGLGGGADFPSRKKELGELKMEREGQEKRGKVKKNKGGTSRSGNHLDKD